MDGIKVEMPSSSFILPARTIHTHTASFMPLTPGHLQIKGCTIKFSALKAHQFSLLSEQTRREKENWYDKNGGEIKVNQIGMGFMKNRIEFTEKPESIKIVDDDAFWKKKIIEATVLPPQPSLVLENSSSRDSSIMLLEGET
jgi:Transport protein Trs120 or TRAPPC9, TRAPP II complex subunit